MSITAPAYSSLMKTTFADNYDLAVLSSINIAINKQIGYDPTLGWCELTDDIRRLASCKGYAMSKFNRAVLESVAPSSMFICLGFCPVAELIAPTDENFRNHAFLLISTETGYRVASNGIDELSYLRTLRTSFGWRNFARYLHGPQPQTLESFTLSAG